VKNLNTPATAAALEALESRIAYRIAARLSQRADDSVDGDVAERLRFAREQALERAKSARAAESRPVVAVSAGGAAVLGRGGWWLKLGSALPLLALAVGLFLIQHLHTQAQIEAAAQIDVELLADDLPPEAYNDAGFVEFLKSPHE
jgi:hypothetical protein